MIVVVKRYRPFILLVGVWLLISLAGSAITGLIIKHGIDAQQGKLNRDAQRLFNGQVAACVRADIQAVKDNRSQSADWTVDKLFVASIETPPPGQTPAQRAAAKRYLAPLKAAVATKAWVPPIQDCTATVQRHGANFALPEPVPFNRRQPPRSALRLPPPPPLSPPAATHVR